MSSASATEPFVFAPASPAVGSGTSTASAGSSGQQLVDQARQEISCIVREVATAGQSDRDRSSYLRFLTDRILRAMAAHGIVIWTTQADSSTDAPYRVEHRLGTLTDLGFDSTATAVHQRLLREVASDAAPVVVPPTPGASEVDTPANPSELPVAIVPIQVDPTSDTPDQLIEVFLEPGGTAASMRGCLRFLAQMGDLAGEFLRADRLRNLTHELQAMQRTQQRVDALLQIVRTDRAQTAWVDAIAEILSVSRVTLCRVEPNHDPSRQEAVTASHPKIIAVSHVDQIDHHGDAARLLRDVAVTPLPLTQGPMTKRPLTKGLVWKQVNEANEDQRDNTGEHSEPYQTIVASTSAFSTWRILIQKRVPEASGNGTRSDSSDDCLSTIERSQLHRLLVGGEQAWTNAHRLESIPGGRLWARFWDQSDDSQGTTGTVPSRVLASRPSLRRRLLRSIAACLVVIAILCLPIPAIVPATGVIRPLQMDAYHAAHDCIVESLQVVHGQTVRRGDMLAKLSSQQLQEDRIRLLGRRSVLTERLDQWKSSLVASSHSTSRSTPASTGQEIEEEIASIDNQLEILNASQEQLVLRARNDGKVDAWRLQERLHQRPLRRGQEVLRVINDETLWVVDARVSQKRVQSVSNAMASELLRAEVSPRWSPGETLPATAQRFGPVTMDPLDGTAAVILRLELSDAPQIGDQPLAETPARIALRCGRTPLGWFLVEDVVNWTRTQVASHF